MYDMLVRLYALPDGALHRAAAAEQGITIRPCKAFELHALCDWVQRTFSTRWVSECSIAMSHVPCGCLVATFEHRIVGFVCYDATARGFLGPMGIDPAFRGKGLGAALLISGLEQMHAMGYGYAIIGGVGPAQFYAKTVGATPIEGSDPGIYADILPEPKV